MLMEILFKVVLFAYFLPFFAFLAYPILVYLTTGQVVPILPVYLPMIDDTTYVGLLINTAFHLSLMVVAAVGFTAMDYFIAVGITSSLIFAKLISLDLQQINFDLIDSEMMTAKARFWNVLLMHREMSE